MKERRRRVIVGMLNKTTCWHRGCPTWQSLTACFLPDGTFAGNFCLDHCQPFFCWGCGQFWAGIESFDFNPIGLCDNCNFEFRDELGEYDHYDYDWQDYVDHY